MIMNFRIHRFVCDEWAAGDVVNTHDAKNDKRARSLLIYYIIIMKIIKHSIESKNNKLQNNYQTAGTRALDILIHIVQCEIQLLWKTLD